MVALSCRFIVMSFLPKGLQNSFDYNGFTNQSFVSILTNRLFLTVVTVLIIGFLVNHLSSPKFDPREPPLVKPRIPIIGHLIGLIRYQNEYFNRLGYAISELANLIYMWHNG